MKRDEALIKLLEAIHEAACASPKLQKAYKDFFEIAIVPNHYETEEIFTALGGIEN